MKTSEFDKLKDFISYRKRTSFALHVVCHDNKSHHYSKVPFMKIIGRKNILERDKILRSIISLFFISTCIVILLMCLFQLWIAVFMSLGIFLMWEYVFIQLHLDDIHAIRVFELSFNNETKQNMQNMGITNQNNRTHEIITIPIFKHIYQELPDFNHNNSIISLLSKIVIFRLIITLFILIYRHIIRYNNLRQYLVRIPKMYDGLNYEICQRQEVLHAIISENSKLEIKNLKVLGIEYVVRSLLYD